MRIVIQRVSRASCSVDGQISGTIEKGLCLFVGFSKEDVALLRDEKIEIEALAALEPASLLSEIRKKDILLARMIDKTVHLRIFEDEEGKMNRSVLDVKGSVLSISQFTLYAQCKKGRRPSFAEAAPAKEARMLYDTFNALLAEKIHVETGIFQADMKIDLRNDGPVTILLDSKEVL